ncbi:MAG: response regulator [Bryobacteraceae bacterium]|nr:response regulator [Bryobacteraceae bacterium]MDW8379079.1 response regulator [Bryobacterales bacterium]
MAQTQDALLLREAVTAAKLGNKAAARQLLRQASVHNPNNELVWLWRASLSESPKEAIFYLGEVLRINPQNQKATAWLDKCKGQTPSGKAPEGLKPVGQNLSQPPEPEAALVGSVPTQSATPGPVAPQVPSPTSGGNPGTQLPPSVSPSFPVSATSKPQPVSSPQASASQTSLSGAPSAASVTTEMQSFARSVQASAESAATAPAAGASSATVGATRTPEADPSPAAFTRDYPAGKAAESRPKPTVIPFVATKASVAPALKPSPAAEKGPKWRCPFCQHASEAVLKRCPTCQAITVLEDLKEIEKNEGVQEKFIREALARYEAIPADKRTFEQNSALALGHLNLREATRAIPYLKAATAQRRNEWALLGILDQLQWRKVILVVDDSLTIRKALSSILEKNDYRVLTAEDGPHALEQLNETVPDLVLLDITMPWMDGYQVCKQIKEKALTRKVPVVMLSGKDGLFDKVRGKLAGCNDYVTKPFDPDMLLKTIKKYLP